MSKMRSSAEMIVKAERLLAMEPSTPARARLLRDLLSFSADDPRLGATMADLEKSQQVRTLLREQRGDGGWGAFHSRSTTARQKTASTEVAVERALSLGLNDSHPALQQTKRYLLGILQGKTPFPDYHEKNDRWPTGMRLFTASTLCLIDPTHSELGRERDLWRQIALRTFQSGSYSEEDEIEAHRELTGATVKGSYLVINNRYALNILGSKKDLLPPGIEEALLSWILKSPAGIGYLGVSLQMNAPLGCPGPLDRWFSSLELLIRLFPHRTGTLKTQLDWIWDCQGADGLWDFGPRAQGSTFLPLADSWRSRRNRLVDWSTRVLLLSSGATGSGGKMQ
jgi:hypothetical protein